MYRITQRNPLRYDYAMAATDVERRALESTGHVWGGLGIAVEAYEKQQQEYAKLSAHRNYEDRNLSAKAKAEAENAEDNAGDEHLPAVPVTPIKRRGRPRKT